MPVSTLEMAAGGPVFSRLVMGTWRLADANLSPPGIRAWIDACLEAGITTFDHADIYGDYTCEERFGAALAESPGLRDRLQLVTKCDIKLISDQRLEHRIQHYDASRAHITASVERSLKNLRSERIDVLLLHRPDFLMDADEVAEAFTALRDAGKVSHCGVSNFTASQLELLASRLDFSLVTHQIELSVMHLDALTDGTLDQCQRLRIVPMAWSPLGGGRLFHHQGEQARRLRATLTIVGNDLGGASKDQVALAWILRHPSRAVPILGTTRVERVRSAARAETLNLSREQWYELWRASTGTEVP